MSKKFDGLNGLYTLNSDVLSKPVFNKSFLKNQDEAHWLHFSVNDVKAAKWLRKYSGIDELTAEAMLAPKVRPRIVVQEQRLLLILRVADTLTSSEYEELRSLRIYMEPGRLITCSIHPLPVVQALMEKLVAEQNQLNGLSITSIHECTASV